MATIICRCAAFFCLIEDKDCLRNSAIVVVHVNNALAPHAIVLCHFASFFAAVDVAGGRISAGGGMGGMGGLGGDEDDEDDEVCAILT